MKNPFEYEGANNLKPETIIDYYIEDFNFSRFIKSKRNIFLIGERGSGKTMTLLYNSFKVQYLLGCQQKNISYDWIGIHIPCSTPIFHKKEYLLLDEDYKKSILCEHFLVLSILYAIADTLHSIPEIVSDSKLVEKDLYTEIEYIWNVQLDPQSSSFFDAIKKYVNKEIVCTQRQVNAYKSNTFYENALSFSATIMPFLMMLTKIQRLKDSHYMLMIDDAHDMNEYQIKTLNSWIAYRDHSLFSFKIATAKVSRPIRVTTTGGSILEGHDYVTIDMEQAYQNETTDFYSLSQKIVQQRLTKTGINVPVQEFFPPNKSFLHDMECCKKQAKEEAIIKYGKDDEQAIADYVRKYYRAIYFRDRSPKANRPPYSGFDTIVDISTGIVRNLLDPCYWMFDKVLNTEKGKIENIPASVQNEIILQRSEKMWLDLNDGLDKIVDNCSHAQAQCIEHLLTELMSLFSRRLQENIAEPRAIVFSMSQKQGHEEEYEKILELIDIARKAQYIYTRMGNSKNRGEREIYYVPNRLMFPNIGLDPHGQYSHVSLKVCDIYNVAFNKMSFKKIKPTYDKELTLF